MGYNQQCKVQTCYYNCCKADGNCPTYPQQCAHYYTDETDQAVLAGVVVGALVGAILLFMVVCLLMKRCGKEQGKDEPEKDKEKEKKTLSEEENENKSEKNDTVINMSLALDPFIIIDKQGADDLSLPQRSVSHSPAITSPVSPPQMKSKPSKSRPSSVHPSPRPNNVPVIFEEEEIEKECPSIKQ